MHLTNAVFVIKLVFILKWWLLSSYEVEQNVKTVNWISSPATANS